MTTREHADRTENLLGHRAEDIHRWIDRYFDAEGFSDFLRGGFRPGYDPYAHRRHRHCREARPEARKEFEGLYPPDVIDAVVERHIRDDYDGYFPYREDFEKGDFQEKYHESHTRVGAVDSVGSEDLAAYFRGKHYETASRQSRTRTTRFLWRFLLPVLTASVLLLGSLFAVIVPLSRENMMDLKKESIRELTAVAVGALEHYAAHVSAGLLSEEEAKYEATEEIRRMRYGLEAKEYYWIIDASSRMVMHPYRQELEGQDMTDYRDREDAAGVYLFREAAELALSEGEGYLSYRWQHWDDPGALAPKLSYVRYFPEWGWIVGTGIYIQDVEEEIDELTWRLTWVFGGISLVSVTLLIWVLTGALRSERHKDEATEGLRETKERYRALAEASTEGYMLISGGAALYANPALCRLTGWSEEALLESGPSGLIDESADDSEAGSAVRKLEMGEAPSGSWTASITRADGSSFEGNLGISRIFLPGSNGYILSIGRPYTAGDHIGVPTLQTDNNTETPESPVGALIKAGNRVEVIEAASLLGVQLTGLLASDSSASSLRTAVADTYDAALTRFADLAAESVSLPPGARAAILSLGSNARQEMTPFSDQDGALVFCSLPTASDEELRSKWLTIAMIVADGLEAIGFPRCDGGVMPMNPRWCLSETEWMERLKEWEQVPSPQALLELNIVLDRRLAWGDGDLYSALDTRLSALSEISPGLMRLFRDKAMHYRPPGTGRRGRSPIDLKEALKPLEIQIRVLSQLHNIPVSGTAQRINALGAAGVLSRDSTADLKNAFETLWSLRFQKQIAGHRQPIRSDDAVSPGELTPLERRHLTACLDVVNDFVSRQSMESKRI